MTGEEKFWLDGKEIGLTLFDFWKFQYSNIYSMQEYIAEFLVAQALGVDKSHNSDYWTLYDVRYRDMRIEVKQTSYYHPWNETSKISNQRTFGITKSHSSYDAEGEDRYERQNDIYVFCLNMGMDRESADPMVLNNWEFYIVPTAFINAHCGDNKSISLGRIRNFGFFPKRYDEIRWEVDKIIDAMGR